MIPSQNIPTVALTLIVPLTIAACRPSIEEEDNDSTGDTGSIDSEDDPNGDDPSTSMVGKLTGISAPEGSTLAVVWLVTSGSPDRAYKAGKGTIVGNTYELQLPEVLDEQAFNSGGLAVGHIVVLPPGIEFLDGPIPNPEDNLEFILGVASEALIWRMDDDDPPFREWIYDFPEGQACGVCQPAIDELAFDRFAPTVCMGLTLDFGQGVCNWT